MRRRVRVVISASLLFGVLGLSAAPGTGKPRRPATRPAAPRVAVYLTTRDLRRTLARQHDLAFRRGMPGGADDVLVDPAARFQSLSAGFGLAMTDTSAYLLRTSLSARLRNEVMRRLFSRRSGIGLSFLRVPIGGSDYIVGAPYTYDDLPAGRSDPTLAHFSLAHDRPYILPMIRTALALNPSISVMANPWTPPAWMKTDDTLITRTGPLGTLLPQYYETFADYLVKFLAGYRAAGVRIGYLGVQNEPLTPLLLVAGIPESYLGPQEEGLLIRDHVAPALKRARLSPAILAYDDGFQRSEAYVPVVMGLAGADVGGLAYHCYLSDATSMSIEHARYPLQPAFETECSSKLSNIEPAQMAIRSLRNWAQGVQLWNVALNQQLGPKIGSGCAGIPGTGPNAGKDCIAPVIVNTVTHRYSLTSDYWALAQFSKFIQLGARRIDSTTPSTCFDMPTPPPPCGLEDVAFRNPDGSQVLVATSNDGRSHTLTVTEHGQSFSYTVPDGATVTFVWSATRVKAG
jgi:glucosylceramidase